MVFSLIKYILLKILKNGKLVFLIFLWKNGFSGTRRQLGFSPEGAALRALPLRDMLRQAAHGCGVILRLSVGRRAVRHADRVQRQSRSVG